MVLVDLKNAARSQCAIRKVIACASTVSTIFRIGLDRPISPGLISTAAVGTCDEAYLDTAVQ